jgi:hypothetical protein
VLFDDFNGAVVENVFIILGILLFLDSIFKRREMSRSLNILLEDDAIEVMKFNRVLSTMNVKHKIVEANKERKP